MSVDFKVGIDSLNVGMNSRESGSPLSFIASGSVAKRLLKHNFDLGALRVFEDIDPHSGELRSFMTLNKGFKKDPKTGIFITNAEGEKIPDFQTVLTNADALLRRDEYLEIDRAIMDVEREELTLVDDLVSAGLVKTFNGMGKTVMEWQRMQGSAVAKISMDPVRRSESTRPEYDTQGIPIPVIHAEFGISIRDLQISRQGGEGLDLTQPRECMRAISEELERLLLGTSTQVPTFGGYTIYGYTDHPDRHVYSITAPTTPGWTPATLITELLAMRQVMYDDNRSKNASSFMLYFSPAWMTYMDADYSATKGTQTLRKRIGEVGSFPNIKFANYLENFDIIMVEMKERTVRLLNGLNFVTIPYDSPDGMEVGMKIIGIKVPQIRSDKAGQIGLIHASAP